MPTLNPVSDAFSKADTISIVQDKRNSHKKAALLEAFEAHEARRVAKRFEFPLPLNMALGKGVGVDVVSFGASSFS